MSFFDNITIEDFKEYYNITNAFNFNEYLKWNALVTYSMNQKTYYTDYKIYTSLQNSNINNIPKTTPLFWILDNQLLYPFIVFDEFITLALQQAKNTISHILSRLSDANDCKKQGFLLLAGHYLQILLNKRAGIDKSAITPAGMVSSESANGVSISFAQTEANKNLFEQFLLQTEHGRQYLELLRLKYIAIPICVPVRNEFSYDDFVL